MYTTAMKTTWHNLKSQGWNCVNIISVAGNGIAILQKENRYLGLSPCGAIGIIDPNYWKP